MEFLPLRLDGQRVYVGFWKRFCSGWVDFLILLPVILLLQWLEGSKTLALVMAVPISALFFLYHVYFNARFGGTPGKLAVKIRITRPDGSRIGWSEAWKRSSVDIAFAAVALSCDLWALVQIDATRYSATGWLERPNLLRPHYPSWIVAFWVLQQIWIWSEVVVLLFNSRKRALHDFIAGTVVVHKAVADSLPRGAETLPREPAPALA